MSRRALVFSAEYQAWETAYAKTLADSGFQVNHTWRWGSSRVLRAIR
jgi:hypothetical protein